MSRVRSASALFLFLLIAIFASFASAQRWDRTVTIWLQHAAPAPDTPASIFVFLGNAEVVITGAVLAGLLLLSRDRRWGIAALQFAAGLAGVSLLAFLLKHVIPHPGPSPDLHRSIPRFGVSTATPFSLPSGHTMRATFIGGTLLRRFPVLAGAVVLCMMAGLVYLGDHWTTDVLAGLCLGWACVEVARGLAAGRTDGRAEPQGVRRS